MPDAAPYVSVAVPTYNQAERLELVLGSFTAQAAPFGWELVVVDDGSVDDTPRVLDRFRDRLPLRAIRQPNRGRAAARNAAATAAEGEILVFCDGDRAVAPGFVEHHARVHAGRPRTVAFGAIREVYVDDLDRLRATLGDELARGDAAFGSRWRRPAYVARIMELVGEDHRVLSPVAWVCCLTSNLSLPRADLMAAGGFDERFVAWGFEHFELGYRLSRAGMAFCHVPEAVNYHFAHRRPPGFYDDGIRRSVEVLRQGHPGFPAAELAAFARGRVPISVLEAGIERAGLH